MIASSQEIISLSNERIFLAGLLIVALGFFTWKADLGITKPLLVSSLRMVIQLFLVGLVLVYVFEIDHPLPVILIALVMLLVAGKEVSSRQKYKIKGFWSYGIGTVSMFISSFAVSVFGLIAIIRADNWWDPRYAIPVLGMLLGNTMTAVALSVLGTEKLPGMSEEKTDIATAPSIPLKRNDISSVTVNVCGVQMQNNVLTRAKWRGEKGKGKQGNGGEAR